MTHSSMNHLYVHTSGAWIRLRAILSCYHLPLLSFHNPSRPFSFICQIPHPSIPILIHTQTFIHPLNISIPTSFLLLLLLPLPSTPYPRWEASTARLNTLHYLCCRCVWTHTHTHKGTPYRMRREGHTDMVFTALHSSLSSSNGPGEAEHNTEGEDKCENNVRQRAPEKDIGTGRGKNDEATRTRMIRETWKIWWDNERNLSKKWWRIR